ncbi:hypothetical protein ACYOEI_32895, partial [Singulisphaera rosea]
DARVREGVARFVGQRWIWGAQPQKPEAIELELRLSKDEDREVRNTTVYYGLSTVVDKTDDVVRRLMAMVVSDPFVDWSRIAWGLSQDRDAAAKVLDEYLAGDDLSAAKAARKHYREITGRNTPLESKGEPVSRAKDVQAFQDLFDYLGQAYPNFKMKGIDWPKVGRELIPRVDEAKSEDQFGLLDLKLSKSADNDPFDDEPVRRSRRSEERDRIAPSSSAPIGRWKAVQVLPSEPSDAEPVGAGPTSR